MALQKTNMDIFTAVRTSNLIQKFPTVLSLRNPRPRKEDNIKVKKVNNKMFSDISLSFNISLTTVPSRTVHSLGQGSRTQNMPTNDMSKGGGS
jgi:hypothetical protein